MTLNDLCNEKQRQQQTRGSGRSNDASSSPRNTKRLAAQIGVLIPPTFGLSLEPIPPPSSVDVVTGSEGVEPSSLPHYWVYHYTTSPISQFLQRQSHLSHRILGREHMQSGLCIRANPSPSTSDSIDDDIAVIATLLAPSDQTTGTNAVQFLFPTAGCISLAKLWHSSRGKSHLGFAIKSATKTTNVYTTGASFLSYDPLGLAVFATAEVPDVTSIPPSVKLGMMYSYDDSTTTKVHSERTKFGIGSSLGFSTLEKKHTTDERLSSSFLPNDMAVWIALRRPRWAFGAQVVSPFSSENHNYFRPFRRMFQYRYGFDTAATPFPTHVDDIRRLANGRPISHSIFCTFQLTSDANRITFTSGREKTVWHTNDTTATTTPSTVSPVLLSIYANCETPSWTSASNSSTISACLSQIITFDRKIINLFEDRCPTIRNTAVWAVELKQTNASCSSSLKNTGTATTAPAASNNSSLSSSTLSAAIAYQLNRNVSMKVHLDNMGVSTAVLFKRWAYPSIICSFIGGLDRFHQRPYFGLGIQVDSDHRTDCCLPSTTVVTTTITEKNDKNKKERHRKAPSSFS